MPPTLYDYRYKEDGLRLKSFDDLISRNQKVTKQVFNRYTTDKESSKLNAKGTFDAVKSNQGIMSLNGLTRMIKECNLDFGKTNMRLLKDELTQLVKLVNQHMMEVSQKT